MSASTIPVVDFTDWFTGDKVAQQRIGHSLAEACRQFGFVQITNHGVAPELVSEALTLGETLFALPMAAKMLAPHPPGYAVHRGYSKPGLEKVNHWVDGDALPDTSTAGQVQEAKESYEVGSEENVDQPNVFLPDSVFPGFRDDTLKLYWELHKASLEFIRALSVGIGLSPDGEAALLTPHSGHGNQLRFLHYPPVQTRLVLEGHTARLPAHTDWGTITLLFQDSRGGLQVESPNQPGTFLDVEPIPGALCMNICDALMRRTNGDCVVFVQVHLCLTMVYA